VTVEEIRDQTPFDLVLPERVGTTPRPTDDELAVLRALGVTPWQTRLVVISQALVLAVVGLVFGVPLGLAAGRTAWRVVAGYVPLDYVPPTAVWALVLVIPVTLLVVNLEAAWPARRAARTPVAATLRAE
jgi:ABC-type lipoprotein release transport system permease subunit